MVMLFFTLVAVEGSRLAIRLYIYANYRLTAMNPKDPRTLKFMASLGMLFDLASIVITGVLVVLTFGSIASVLLVAGTFGTITSLLNKRELIKSISYE